jgi:hypothetical protein
MLDDLDKTLQQLLERELPKNITDQVTITFAAPGDQFPPPSVTLPAINLFLYDVQENRDLRSTDCMVEGNLRGQGVKTGPPARIDCSYLITAWASEGSPAPSEDEHRILGEAMRILLRHPTVPSEVLQGELASQEPPIPTVALQPGRLQAIGEFWQAIGGKPKLALNYTATISVDVFAPVMVPLVSERMLRFTVIHQD